MRSPFDGFHTCPNCGREFTGKATAVACSPRCKQALWKKARKERESAGVVLTRISCRPLAASWEDDVERIELEVSAEDAASIESLPRPEYQELAEGQTQRLGGETVEVADQAGKRWLVRLAQCGLGPCACDLQAWPADHDGPIPEPDVFDALSFHATSEKAYRRLLRLEAAG